MRGLVIAAHGRHYEVRLEDDRRLRCVPRGKRSEFACGDRVRVAATGSGEGVIDAAEPRRSLLYRSDAFREKLIAANATQVLVVVATEPAFAPELVTRCLVAASQQDLRACVVLNKTDLSAGLEAAQACLAPFANAGYAIIELSARQDCSALRDLMRGQVSVLVGQSGMGKSTLANAIVPGANAAVGEISTALDSGRHTTTTTRCYALAGGGALIDSPGLQVFGLAHVPRDELAAGFPEFRPCLGQCRFRDCRHDAEPGCAVLAAVREGRISAVRHAHFRTLDAEMALLKRQARGAVTSHLAPARKDRGP